MWYRFSKTEPIDKSNPSYFNKMITFLAMEELRNLSSMQRNYNPSEKQLKSQVRKFFNYLHEEYENLDKVILETDGKLGPFVKREVHKLFNKNVRKN
jgi:hypothetical protein